MATPLSEDSRAVLGAAAAGGTSDEDELCHVQGARGYTHDIKSSNAGGSTKASLIDMVGEGDFPKLWLLRAALCGTVFLCMKWKTRLGSFGPSGIRGVSPDMPEELATASGLAAALLGAWECLDWACQLTMMSGTAAASFVWRSQLPGAAFGRDLCCSTRTHDCSMRTRVAAWAGASRCAQMRVPSRQSPVI